MAEVHRLQTNDLELGITEAVQKHVSRKLVAPKPVSQRKLDFEHKRPRWLREVSNYSGQDLRQLSKRRSLFMRLVVNTDAFVQ